MAIYHLNAKVISRGKGKSATAAAAYRAGVKIDDERTGLTFDYSRKKGVYATEIIAPDNAPDWVGDRARLWNEVELFETRKNSRLAREFDIALPVELGHEASRELVRTFVSDQFTSQGLVADVAFHDLESHNPHVHVMLTTRRIDQQGFSAKERSLDSKDFLLGLRESWSVHANRTLEQAGNSERIDHRTLEEQGSHRIPQIHLGPDVAAMRDKGIATARGDEYERIQQVNAQLEALLSELAVNSQEISEASTSEPVLEVAVVPPLTAPVTQKKKPLHEKDSPLPIVSEGVLASSGETTSEQSLAKSSPTTPEAPSVLSNPPLTRQQQQQWLLSNFEGLREAIATDRKRRFHSGQALFLDDHELTVGNYHLHYHLPTRRFTITANDGRGEILTVKFSKNQEFFWRTELTPDDLQFLSSLASLKPPQPNEEVQGAAKGEAPPVSVTQQQLFAELLAEIPLEDSDKKLTWEKTQQLYERYTANPSEYALYTDVPDPGGGLNNPRTAGRVAVKKADRDELTESQIELLLVHNPKVPELLAKSGSDSAKEYIQSLITRARKEGIKPYWLSGETASVAYSTYSPQPEQIDSRLLFLAENLCPQWQQVIPELTVNDLHRDLWVAVKALDEGWNLNKTRRILYSSPIAFNNQSPLSGEYRDSLIELAVSLIERIDLQLPEQEAARAFPSDELEESHLAILNQLSSVNLNIPQPPGVEPFKPTKIDFITDEKQRYEKYLEGTDEADNFVQVARQALLDNHTLRVSVFIARQNPFFKELQRLLSRTRIAGNFLQILIEQNLPQLEPQRFQALLKDEKTFEPQESLRILAEITKTIEAKRSLSPSNQKATRYIIDKLTEIVDPLTASSPSAKETVFSLIDRLSQCLESSPLANRSENQKTAQQSLLLEDKGDKEATHSSPSEESSYSPVSPSDFIFPKFVSPNFVFPDPRVSAQPPSTPLEREEELIESPPLAPKNRTPNIRQEPESSQPIAQPPSPQEAVYKSPSSNTSPLTDAQLIAAVRTVKQWEKNCPKEPDWVKGSNLKKLLDDKEKRKANLAQVKEQKQQELKNLGKPRSLLNPFGVSESVMIEKQIEIQETQTALYVTNGELNRLQANFQDWQQLARAYQAWQEDPQTEKMNQLAEQLKSPDIQARLQYLREEYAIYDAAQFILDKRGERSGNSHSFRGNFYRIEQREQTLTITHKERSDPIFVATDHRATGGIIEINQSHLTSQDKEILHAAVQALFQQQQRELKGQQERDRGFGLE